MIEVLHVYKDVEIVNAGLVEGTLKEPPTVTISYDEKPGIQDAVHCLYRILNSRYVDGTRMEDFLARLKGEFALLEATGCGLGDTMQAAIILNALRVTPPSRRPRQAG